MCPLKGFKGLRWQHPRRIIQSPRVGATRQARYCVCDLLYVDATIFLNGLGLHCMIDSRFSYGFQRRFGTDA